MRRLWNWIMARARLSEVAVCNQSAGLGPIDYHDYTDSIEGQPWHFTLLTCKRCGKKFTI